MTAERPVLYLVDGSNALHRAYHAIRQLSNSKGFPTNAVYGFAAILKKLVREHHPSHVGVAFDISESTARKAAFADYKANRKPMDEDLAVQIPLVRRLCEAFRMPLLELHGFEADDVIATLARKAAAEGFDVVIFTTDKDFFQLVSPHVRVFQAARERMLDSKGVEEFFGVPPERVGDVLALMGDASDNVPGVPGIGEVTARKLVLEFGDLESVLSSAGKVSAKKVRETLMTNAEQARLSRRLVELDTALPVEFDPVALHLDPPDLGRLRALYSELEFHSLANELSAPEESESPAVEARSENLPEIRDREAGIFTRRIGGDLLFAVSSGGESFADLAPEESSAQKLAPILSDPSIRLTTPDAKAIQALAIRAGIDIRATIFDVSLARYVLACGTSNPEFAALALDLLHRRALTDREAGIEAGREINPSVARNLAAERASWTRELAPILEAELSARKNLTRVFAEIETPLTRVLAAMEEAGVLLDVDYLNELSRGMATDLARLEAEIFSAAGEAFNVASPPQLARILFEKLNLPAGRRTAKTRSFSTGVETLQQLSADGHRIAGLILEHREISKLKGTYADALPALVDEGSRVHARFNQTVAATGRLSSSDPNLQNIPIRTEAGRRIRRAFIAPQGHLLLAADYSQIELRILAHLSGDEAMIRAFSEGVDIHAATASKIFGVAQELVNIEMRTAAKRVNFGLLYGMGASSLARDLAVPLAEARQFIEAYFARFPKVRETLEAVVEGARREGHVTTLFGRERPIPEIHSANGGVRSNAERMAQNAPFQGTAADIVKIAMIAVQERLARRGLAARMILQVHDELVFEVPGSELDATREVVVESMESAAALDVPLRVDVGSGPDWLSAKG